MSIFRFLLIVILFIVSGCAPLTTVQGDSVYVATSPFLGQLSSVEAELEAVRICGPDKKPVLTAYSPGLFVYSEAIYVCQPAEEGYKMPTEEELFKNRILGE